MWLSEFVSFIGFVQDWWHKRKAFQKLLRKVCEGKKSKKVGRSKPSKYPEFAGVVDVLGPRFSDFLFHGKTFEEFHSTSIADLGINGINVAGLDPSHAAAFVKIMASAKVVFDSVKPEMNTQANEAFHAHGRFWWSKTVQYIYTHWRAKVACQVLSLNNRPGWREEVLTNFLNRFAK